MSLLLGRLDPANGAKLASEPDDLFIATCLSRTLDAQSLRIPATPETRPFSMMNTIVMTGGTSGLGEVAARRFIETPNTRLLLVRIFRVPCDLLTLPLMIRRLENVL